MLLFGELNAKIKMNAVKMAILEIVLIKKIMKTELIAIVRKV